jgi:hypothetical protein
MLMARRILSVRRPPFALLARITLYINALHQTQNKADDEQQPNDSHRIAAKDQSGLRVAWGTSCC